ncbi:J domain-containing protein [Arcticibacter sp. MXS-1]|uniref:J domain-containing protein n=1 Tax=Arcticibacter sp. MXS-1 TaxID=3341726 RepID=UPI0035A9098B
MFVDYYAVLGVESDAPDEAVKDAYKTQALRWHPDKNAGTDTTSKMQLINEAYLVLKDQEGRKRYDKEYERYKEHHKQAAFSGRSGAFEGETGNQPHGFRKGYEDQDYTIQDETLRKWMANARKQAIALAKETLEDIKGISKESGKAMISEALFGLVRLAIFGTIMSVIFKACH